MLHALEITQDKAVIGKPGVDRVPNPFILGLFHILVVIDVHEAAVFVFDLEIEIQCKAGVMLGITGPGHGFCRVIRTVLLSEAIHDVLLCSNTAAGRVEFQVNAAVFFEVCF